MERSFNNWLADLASGQPTPGGGGASAAVGAIGIALGSMVGNLTTGKKKYVEVQQDIEALLTKSESVQAKFQQLVRKDAECFTPLAAAYGLPSSTEEERQAKDAALQSALIGATETPLAIAETAVEALYLLQEYAQKGSRLVLSDAGVGASCCRTALEGANLNVLINLKLMRDETAKETYDMKMKELMKEGIHLADSIYQFVKDRL